MKKTFLSVLAVVLVLTTLFSGCSGKAEEKSQSTQIASAEKSSESPASEAPAAIAQKPAEEQVTLTVYAYDSFVSEWGVGPGAAADFEAKTGIAVKLVSAGDSGQVLQRAILEKDAPRADIIVGIDNNLIKKALQAKILAPYEGKIAQDIPQFLLIDESMHLIPFDYGYFSIIYDSEKITTPPMSLEELTLPEYEKSIILMDPRTSSPGLGFLLWTISTYGEDFISYWEKLKPSILTVTDGWDSGYGLFTNGEAPMVLSYSTSPAYHVEYEETERYKAAMFPAGHYMQVEGVGMLAGTKHPEEAQQFIEYMMGETFQSTIPLSNFMYPVTSSTELPESFEFAPKAAATLMMDGESVDKNLDRWLDQWTQVMSK